MKICMVAGEFNYGGIGHYVANLAKALTKQGNAVTVITRGSLQSTQLTVKDGIKVFKVAFPPLYPFHVWIHGVFINKVVKRLESEWDILHLHTPFIPVIQSSLPKLVTIHSLNRNMFSVKSITNLYSLLEILQYYTVDRLEVNVLKNADKITSVSYHNLALLTRLYNMNPSDATVIGNGVDDHFFCPDRTKNPSRKTILYVGRLTEEKGVKYLLQAMEFLKTETPQPLHLVIAGDGHLRSALEHHVALLGLHQQVTFLGRVSQEKLKIQYQRAYLQVLPSLSEGLPNVLLEGMAAGLPIVASAVGGIPDVITPGREGFLVPPRAPKKMADAIRALLEDSNLQHRIGIQARQTIKARYTWRMIADKFLKCYKELMT